MKEKTAALLIIITCLLPYRITYGQDTVATGYELAGSMFDQKGNWDEALRNWLKALAVYSKQGEKEAEVKIIDKIAGKYYQFGVYKKAADYYEQIFNIYSNDNLRFPASAAEMAAMAFYYLPSDSSALKWFDIAENYYERSSDTSGVIRCNEKLASIFVRQGLFNEAGAKYDKLYLIYSNKNDFKNLALVMNQMGYLLFKKKEYQEALTYFKSAIELSERNWQDEHLLTDIYSNIAICYQNLSREKEMLLNFQTALKHAESSGRIDEKARIERLIALIYFNKGDNYQAEVYCLNSIESARLSANSYLLQLVYKDYSSVLEKGNDFVKALDYYEQHLRLRDSLNFISKLKEKAVADNVTAFETTEQRIKFELADVEIKDLELKNLKTESARRENELKLLTKERELDRSEKDRLAQSLALEQEKMQVMENEQKVKSLEQQKKIQELQIKRKDDEALVLQKTNESLEKDKILKETELRNEKFARKMAVWLGILMVLVAIIILLSLISSRKKNQKLAESKKQIEKINRDLEIKNIEVLNQNEKISQQKDIIEQKNQSITDSIQYASRIQTAVLPPIDFITEWGIENFILYKPKDIVSGDFYWGLKKEDRIIIAAGDCTGHGVPGAFMSMLGHALLDEIVNTTNFENAAMILDMLREGIINTLKQKGNVGEARDGMDISLVILNMVTGRLDFAGANNPLYLIREGVLTKIQGDRMPIGIHYTALAPFTNQTIDYYKGDRIYIFSDGYADQFGGPKGKKFMYKPFQDLLLSIYREPMVHQKEILDNSFKNWKGSREQVDDVLVIGVHI